MIITASLVLYKNKSEEIDNIIPVLTNSILNIIFIIDNSPIDNLRYLFKNKKFIYIHNPVNPGFGSSHNIAFDLSFYFDSNYHFLINPDIIFDNNDVFSSMINYIDNDDAIGMMMPEILNLDKTKQHLPKLIPSPLDLIRRKLKFYNNFKFLNKYELRFVEDKLIYNTPILSGCFLLLRTSILKEIGKFDEKYFMYFEDFDLSRRFHQNYKTIYFPKVSVTHKYQSGANKKFKLFLIFINSAIIYFNKWGWINDQERIYLNNKTLNQF